MLQIYIYKHYFFISFLYTQYNIYIYDDEHGGKYKIKTNYICWDNLIIQSFQGDKVFDEPATYTNFSHNLNLLTQSKFDNSKKKFNKKHLHCNQTH